MRKMVVSLVLWVGLAQMAFGGDLAGIWQRSKASNYLADLKYSKEFLNYYLDRTGAILAGVADPAERADLSAAMEKNKSKVKQKMKRMFATNRRKYRNELQEALSTTELQQVAQNFKDPIYLRYHDVQRTMSSANLTTMLRVVANKADIPPYDDEYTPAEQEHLLTCGLAYQTNGAHTRESLRRYIQYLIIEALRENLSQDEIRHAANIGRQSVMQKFMKIEPQYD